MNCEKQIFRLKLLLILVLTALLGAALLGRLAGSAAQERRVRPKRQPVAVERTCPYCQATYSVEVLVAPGENAAELAAREEEVEAGFDFSLPHAVLSLVTEDGELRTCTTEFARFLQKSGVGKLTPTEKK
jgi:hypothetical protein